MTENLAYKLEDVVEISMGLQGVLKQIHDDGTIEIYAKSEGLRSKDYTTYIASKDQICRINGVPYPYIEVKPIPVEVPEQQITNK